MWSFEHSEQSGARTEDVFRLWADVAGWPRWDEGIERVELDGPFEPGMTGRLTAVGQQPLPFKLTEVAPGAGFTDETYLPGATIRFRHRVEPEASGRVRITHRVEIEGPAADAISATIGAGIMVGMPFAVAALAVMAEGARA